MASSSSASPQPPDQPPPDQDHVHLRITYLVTGNPRPPHYLRNLHLNTTIAALKERIQSELPEHPTPPEQRLIYQGRPLLRNDANLRDVLRIQPGAVPDALPYTVHIVIHSQHNTSNPPQPSNPILNPRPPAPLQPVHQPADFTNPFTTGPFTTVETSANHLQESLGRIQQQLDASSADLRTAQQRIAIHRYTLGIPPTVFQTHVDANGQPQPGPQPQTFGTSLHVDLPLDQRAHAQRPPGRGHSHPRQPPNAVLVHPHSHGTAPAPLGPPQHAVQTFPSPNGERMMTVTMPVPGPPPGSRQQPAAQSQPQTTTSTQAPHVNPSPAGSTMLPPSINWNAAMSIPPTSLPISLAPNRPSPSHPSNTTAWLLSSPMGPQALLFAPGHGYFTSSAPRPRQQQAGGVPDSQLQTNGSSGTEATQPAQVNIEGQQNADRAIVRANQPQPGQPQPVPALAQAQQNGEDNDLFGFIINRGWLFLRLYLFMFVFSEPGTWKRWLMIIAAAIICLQPRDGPFTRMLTAARRHLDNLIGPTPPQPPPEAVAQQQNPAANQPGAGQLRGNAAQRPAHVRGAIRMTPEEARARLHQGRQTHQQPFWRDTLYRVEQSIALFLASLIPGVGERHVRARAEARREEQRREEERTRAEADAAAQRQNGEEADAEAGEMQGSSVAAKNPEVDLGGLEEQSASTSVQVGDGEGASGELRNRT
ncbi:uncharacterized protein Z519_09548 [Cladophialophora bantiana CBS 173.52]|uniref:Ubiquitin-like domain-containing protein n=1 Tax=Cladophialophora bantiana (strain ATCC 10958 / CBS 173.52 / CDC B-1940 / NIH 8579) TaxID=1442370 RepID=A0A0D2FUA0_CLAB1|nr:uncharacterized protein Z519_09548 [Cladophialophora bantiana CBS 173.52]KIW90117.1 hypothetical protein Z519_09548 [Cladophialophora bantiana CBS 173.52]